MNHQIRFIILWILIAVICVCIIKLAIFTILHPDMTKTRIGIENWPVIALAMLAAIIAKLLIHNKNT